MIIFKHNTAIVTRPSQYIQAIKLASGRYTFHCSVKHFQDFLTIRIEGVSGTWYSYTVPCIAGGWALNNIANITFTLPERGKSFDMCADAGVSPSNPVYIQRLMLEEGDNVSTHRINEQDLDEQIDDSIEAATYWVIKTSSPVIYKDAPDAATPGVHTPVVISGELRAGTKRTPGGKITITPAGGEESVKFPSPYTLLAADTDQISDYTLKLYSEIDDSLLDEEVIHVVFAGATGVDALVFDLSNDKDILPADKDGNVLNYLDSGAEIRIYEGADLLTWDGIGSSQGKYKVIVSGTNITPDPSPTWQEVSHVLEYGDASGMSSNRAAITYTAIGQTLEGFPFELVKQQSFSIAKTGEPGATGDGILDVIDYYGVSMSASVLPTAWQTTVPAKGANEYLWNYEKILYTDGTFTETEKRVIQGKDGRGITSIVNAYGYSTDHTTPPTIWYYLAQLPEKQPGQVLWVREDITYTDGTSNATIGYPVRDGEKGEPGDGILEVIDYYGVSNNASILPAAWQTTVPAQGANEYLWNYEKILYTDSTFTETEKRVIQGKDGRGIISIVNAYGYSTDHTTPPTTWYYLSQLPEKQPGQVLWVREDITYTDETSGSTVGYPVRDGEKGETGLPGQITIQKEWKPGDVHRNDDYIIDFIYVRAANKTDRKFYKLKSGCTSRTVPAGETIPSTSTLDTYYDEVAWMLALALKFLIAEEGNFANFIFKNQMLISLRGTVNGAAVDYDAISDSDRAIFQPNITIDGKTGEITAAGGKVKFRFDGSGYIADQNIEWDALGNSTVYGMIKGSVAQPFQIVVGRSNPQYIVVDPTWFGNNKKYAVKTNIIARPIAESYYQWPSGEITYYDGSVRISLPSIDGVTINVFNEATDNTVGAVLVNPPSGETFIGGTTQRAIGYRKLVSFTKIGSLGWYISEK